MACLVWPAMARAECVEGNLLEHRSAKGSRGVDKPALLTDGWLAPDGAAFNVPEAARMTSMRPFVEWDLGEAVTLKAAAIQGDHDDDYRLIGSVDGKQYEEIYRAASVPEGGLRLRASKDLDHTVRFVRVEAMGGDQSFSAAEVRVYCQVPKLWPPAGPTRASLPIHPDAMRTLWLRSGKVVLGLLSLFLLGVILPRLTRPRVQRGLLVALALAGALAWTQFGFFQGGGRIIQPWDGFHYVMGSKYFHEIGYVDLYRCVAKAEREAGRGALLDAKIIRDVEDDNRIHPGTWTRTHAGRCRAEFTPERWAAFKRDAEAFRKILGEGTFVDTLGDHGYNATPIHSAWLKLWSSSITISERSLGWLGQLDSFAFLVGLGFLYWGFGWEATALGALVIGLGYPWGYNWVGGSFGRAAWVMWACAALALLKKDRPFLGAAALTMAGLLRLFPFVFVGGMGLWVVVGWIRSRKLTPAFKRILAGVALTTALGVVAGGAVNGFRSYGEFAQVVKRHGSTPLSNQMSLQTLLAWGPGRTTADMVDPRLTNPFETWREMQLQARKERAPVWAFAVLCSIALVVWGVTRGLGPAEAAAATGPLLFSLQAMTSYDYVWLLVMVPLALGRPRRMLWLLGFVVFTQVIALAIIPIEIEHVIFSGALLVALVGFSIDLVRELAAAPRAAAPRETT